MATTKKASTKKKVTDLPNVKVGQTVAFYPSEATKNGLTSDMKQAESIEATVLSVENNGKTVFLELDAKHKFSGIRHKDDANRPEGDDYWI